jgi:hypothetical protein
VALRQSTWAYPLVEAAHIVGLTTLVGAAFMFDLRLLGWAKHVSLDDAARQLLPWARRGFFFLVLPTGLLLFSTNATAFVANRAFQVKMMLIATAGLNAIVFRAFMTQRLAVREGAMVSHIIAKVHAVLSILLWTGIIFAGRLIAYF